MDAIDRLVKATHKYKSRTRGKDGKYVYSYDPEGRSGIAYRPETPGWPRAHDYVTHAERMNPEGRPTPMTDPPEPMRPERRTGPSPARKKLSDAEKKSWGDYADKKRAMARTAKSAVARAYGAKTRVEAEAVLHEHGYNAKEVKKLLTGKTFPGGAKKWTGETSNWPTADSWPQRKSMQDDSLTKGAIPKAYLFDYLCARIEEAYEHEAREQTHKFVEARDLPKHMARAVMGELVQRMAWDDNLKRACSKYRVTLDTVSDLLVKKGILRTRSDAMPTESDSHAAMGAGMLAEAEVMAFSQPAPWMQKSDPNADMVNRGVGRLTDRSPANVAHTLRDDTADPHVAVRKSMDAERMSLGRLPQQPDTVRVTVASDCPVHARDLSKAQNLYNAMTPCTCGDELNAYG